jgi:hypothetical protein
MNEPVTGQEHLDALRLMRAFFQIQDPKSRREIIALVEQRAEASPPIIVEDGSSGAHD